MSAYFIPERTRLATNTFWKQQNRMYSGAITTSVAAQIFAHIGPDSLAFANRDNPTVSGRLSTELMTIIGQRKLFQWVLMEQMAKAT